MKRLFWAAMGVALISMVFAGCKEEEPTYAVQVTATEGGTVEGQNGEYKEGETVVFTAVPADGYYFTIWDGSYFANRADAHTNNPLTIIVSTSDISITAKFIGVSPKEGGIIEMQKEGYTFVLKAIPAYGYLFSQWSDGNTDNPRTIRADITLTAEFVLPTTVDLGLTSGNLWATCNVGAIKPWWYGDYYAWGETQTKDKYSFKTYKYCNGTSSTLTKYCCDSNYGKDGFTDTLTSLEPADDAATVVLGAEYSMPTLADWKELVRQCYWVWTGNYDNQNVSGFIVYRAKADKDKGVRIYNSKPSASYSLSDAHIFLPACHSAMDNVGYYWSSELDKMMPDHAWCFNFVINQYDSGNFGTDNRNRSAGFSVRPVKRP